MRAVHSEHRANLKSKFFCALLPRLDVDTKLNFLDIVWNPHHFRVRILLVKVNLCGSKLIPVLQTFRT